MPEVLELVAWLLLQALDRISCPYFIEGVPLWHYLDYAVGTFCHITASK